MANIDPADIWLALKSRLNTLVMNPVMAIYDPGATIPKDSATPAPDIIIGDLRNDTVRRDISGQVNTNSGTMIATIRWPIHRAATHAQLMAMAATIVAHFPADLRMRSGTACLRVLRQPDIIGIGREETRDMVRVRIPWSTL